MARLPRQPGNKRPEMKLIFLRSSWSYRSFMVSRDVELFQDSLQMTKSRLAEAEPLCYKKAEFNVFHLAKFAGNHDVYTGTLDNLFGWKIAAYIEKKRCHFLSAYLHGSSYARVTPVLRWCLVTSVITEKKTFFQLHGPLGLYFDAEIVSRSVSN